jgi:cell division initiation protein
MKISAQDIEQQRFKRKLRGYDPQEVEAFLRMVAAEVQRLTLEREEARAEFPRLRAQLDEARKREETLHGAIAAAERIAEQMRGEGQREADALIEAAKVRSERMVENAQRELSELDREITRLHIERETFENRVRVAIEEHRRLLDLRRERSVRSDSLADNLKVFRRPSTGAED